MRRRLNRRGPLRKKISYPTRRCRRSARRSVRQRRYVSRYTDRAQATKSQEQQQQLTEQAQGDMIKAINDQGLSVQQYNQVIQMAQADPSLKERLLSVAQAGH